MKNLAGWTQEVFTAIKKDIKSDHLPASPTLHKAHFGNRPLNRISTEEIFAAYEKELQAGNQELAEFVVNRWVFKNGDLYQHFADRLSAINPQFDEIKQLTKEESESVLKGAVETFGAIPTFIFTALNGVVFPEEILGKLKDLAEKERVARKIQEEAAVQQQTLEKIVAAHQREMARMEDKIIGVQKKYENDVAALKKQIKALQKK